MSESVTFLNLFVEIDNSSIPIFSIRKFTREEQHLMCDDAILLGLSMYRCLNKFKLLSKRVIKIYVPRTRYIG